MGLFGKIKKKFFKAKDVQATETVVAPVVEEEIIIVKPEAVTHVDETPHVAPAEIIEEPKMPEEIIIEEPKAVEIEVKEALYVKPQDAVNKYVAGLDKSRGGFASKVTNLFKKTTKIDEDFFEELENILIMSDISVEMVMTIVEEVKTEIKAQNITDEKTIKEIIADKMFVIYANWSDISTTLNVEEGRLNVILMVGVNGAGKTTTIAKLTKRLKDQGKTVMVAAGDTFRAGAVDQLAEWANRLGIECVKPVKENGDPASVMFDAVKKAKEANVDVLICDTAGRLQNKVNLMKELEKINNVIKREIPNGPHETLLVVDATTGQNGISQAKHFTDVTPVTGIVLSKMDGTSKGGIILSVKEHLNIPVKFMGLGEKMDDLQEFDLEAYIYGLLKDWM